MRLVNTQTFELEEYFTNVPTYAILSHTWGDEEVTFQDWQQRREAAKEKKGFAKIENACNRAREDGHRYLWCDTNCIDKTSSAELSEAINSMFRWYAGSAVCYAFLVDVPSGPQQEQDESFRASRWFTRGWTLQELLAPMHLLFFTQDWTLIGDRLSLSEQISSITMIAVQHMTITGHIRLASISERISWLSRRETTRIEDMAYCMLGIFDINMPLLYGEGTKAFIRLQEEIMRVSNDQTIFCWTWDTNCMEPGWASMLAPSPRLFRDSAKYSASLSKSRNLPYSMTNSGLSINLPLLKYSTRPAQWLGILEVRCKESTQRVSIPLIENVARSQFYRSDFPPTPMPVKMVDWAENRDLYIARNTGPIRFQPKRAPKRQFKALIALSGFNLPEMWLETYPVLDDGCLEMHVCHPETSFGSVFGVEMRPVTGKRQSRSVALMLLGVFVESNKFYWCCKLEGLVRERETPVPLKTLVSEANQRLQSGAKDFASIFDNYKSSGGHEAIFPKGGLSIEAFLGAPVRTGQFQETVVAQIRLSHAVKKPKS